MQERKGAAVQVRQKGGSDGAAVAAVQSVGDGGDGSGHGSARAVGAAVAGETGG